MQVEMDEREGEAPGGSSEAGWSRRLGLSQVGSAPQSTGDLAVDRSLVIDRIHRYGWAVDERDADGVADCFTEHAVWEGWQRGDSHTAPVTGRNAIAEFMRDLWLPQHQQRRHIFTNEVVDDVDRGTARAHAYLVLLSSDAELTALITTGPYRFELERSSDDVWRIAHLIGGWDSPFRRSNRAH